MCGKKVFHKRMNTLRTFVEENRPFQQIRDAERQQKVIDILHPKKFWRYDAVNKTITNVLGKQ